MSALLRTTAALALTAAPALAQDAETQVVGVSIPAATYGWAGDMNFHAQEAVARLEEVHPNLDSVLATAANTAEQVSDIEDMVATCGLDALVVLPLEREPLNGPVKAGADRSNRVTVTDRGLSEPGIEDLCVAGFEEAIAGSGIEVLGMEHGIWRRDDSFTVMQDVLSRVPEIDAVWAPDDDMAAGVLAAIEAAGRGAVRFVLGGAGMKEMIARTRDNDRMIPAHVTDPPAMIGTATEIAAMGLVSSAPVSGTFTIGSVPVTPENAAEHCFPDRPF